MVHAGRILARGAALSAAALALAAPAQADAGIPEHRVSQARAEVLDYWTPDRIAQARPASELLAGIPAPNDLLDGQLGSAGPTPRAAAQQIGDPAQPPFRKHGKVLFSLAAGNYQCSATVVVSRIKRLVVTAGHCVYGFGQFATNWMFIPAKNDAAEPYGRWTATRLATTPQWRASEDIAYDVGTAVIKKRSRRLQEVVGARRIAFNRDWRQNFEAFGYPAEGPSRFDGRTPFRCSSAAEARDPGPGPDPIRIDCDMTGGSSGGGWVIERGQVNSVTSYGYDPLCPILCPDPDGEKLYGPYFGETVKQLYRSQRGKRR